MSWKKILKEKVPTFEETGAFDGAWEEDEKPKDVKAHRFKKDFDEWVAGEDSHDDINTLSLALTYIMDSLKSGDNLGLDEDDAYALEIDTIPKLEKLLGKLEDDANEIHDMFKGDGK